jgi:hypothetical protein
MYRYVGNNDLVCCRHVSEWKEYRPGLLRSCIDMQEVWNWFVAVMYRYARSIDLVCWCHVSVC